MIITGCGCKIIFLIEGYFYNQSELSIIRRGINFPNKRVWIKLIFLTLIAVLQHTNDISAGAYALGEDVYIWLLM